MPIIQIDTLADGELLGLEPSVLHAFEFDGSVLFFASGGPSGGTGFGFGGIRDNGELLFGAVLDASGGGVDLTNLTFYDSTLTSVEIGGETFLYVSGEVRSDAGFDRYDAITVFGFDDNGALELVGQSRDTEAPTARNDAPQFAEVGNRTYMIASNGGDNAFTSYRVLNDGSLRVVDNFRSDVDQSSGIDSASATVARVG